MTKGMAGRSAYLATYAVTGAALAERGLRVINDVDRGRILRSVLMKPEAELTIEGLHRQVETLTVAALSEEDS